MPAQLSAASVLGTGGLAGTAKKFSPFGTVDTLGFETGAAPTSGQSAPQGGTVTNPPAVKVKTPPGVGMKGITVTFSVTGGGGTLTPVGGGSPSSSVIATTDDTGYVATGSWTLGTGTNTVTAVATPPHPGSGIDPLTGVAFTATANPPVKLGYSVQPTNQTAGTAFGVTVVVQDVNGATVPASSAGVSLTLNGGPAGTLQGTATATASQGVATFSNLVITRAGTYTITASSSPLTSATSSSFTISAAAPQTIAINAGNSQTAAEGTILGVAAGTTAPSVIIKDAYANPVSRSRRHLRGGEWRRRCQRHQPDHERQRHRDGRQLDHRGWNQHPDGVGALHRAARLCRVYRDRHLDHDGDPQLLADQWQRRRADPGVLCQQAWQDDQAGDALPGVQRSGQRSDALHDSAPGQRGELWRDAVWDQHPDRNPEGPGRPEPSHEFHLPQLGDSERDQERRLPVQRS